MKTNILVQYQGGGYDGCIWEWNYFYIDKQETFHDIQSSGCDGVDNKQDAQDLIDRNESGTHIYDLDNEQDILTFSRESHPVHVIGVLQWFNDNIGEHGVQFFAECSECKGQIANHNDAVIEGDMLLCWECFSVGECPCCEHYAGADDIVAVDEDEHHGYDYVCVGCKEYHDAEREALKFEDLVWQSFCTGMPDMFSGVMRERRLYAGCGGGL